MSDSPSLPTHVEQTIEAIAELHRQHQRRATPSQKVVAQMTALVSRPRFVGYMTIVLALWIGVNGLMQLFVGAAWDPPPFSYVQAVAGVGGLYVVLLVLITQRRENELTEARGQLTLELAILSEQKSAKIIALLEEQRRDSAALPNRVDDEAEQFAQSADPHAVLEALRSSNEELAQSVGLEPLV